MIVNGAFEAVWARHFDGENCDEREMKLNSKLKVYTVLYLNFNGVNVYIILLAPLAVIGRVVDMWEFPLRLALRTRSESL